MFNCQSFTTSLHYINPMTRSQRVKITRLLVIWSVALVFGVLGRVLGVSDCHGCKCLWYIIRNEWIIRKIKAFYGSMIPFVANLPDDDLILIGIFVTRRIRIFMLTSWWRGGGFSSRLFFLHKTTTFGIEGCLNPLILLRLVGPLTIEHHWRIWLSVKFLLFSIAF